MENIFEPIYISGKEKENTIEFFYGDLLEKFRHYPETLSISIFCPLAEPDSENDENPVELACITYKEDQITFEIVSKRYFYPRTDFSPETFLDDLDKVLVVMSDFEIDSDGEFYALADLVSNKDTSAFIEKYFTPRTHKYNFKVK